MLQGSIFLALSTSLSITYCDPPYPLHHQRNSFPLPSFHSSLTSFAWDYCIYTHRFMNEQENLLLLDLIKDFLPLLFTTFSSQLVLNFKHRVKRIDTLLVSPYSFFSLSPSPCITFPLPPPRDTDFETRNPDTGSTFPYDCLRGKKEVGGWNPNLN